MNEKVRKYREKHKRCKYCTYLKPEYFGENSWYICKAKEKIIKDLTPNMICVPRPFCKCYEVRDE